MGYANVWDYGEGKIAWIAAGLPVEGRSRRLRGGIDEGTWRERSPQRGN